MRARLYLVCLFCFFSILLSAKCRHYCNVRYKTENGWSEVYRITVLFETGNELNTATGSYDYDQFSNYAIISLGQATGSTPGWGTYGLSDKAPPRIIILSSDLSCVGVINCNCIENSNYELKGIDTMGIYWKISPTD